MPPFINGRTESIFKDVCFCWLVNVVTILPGKNNYIDKTTNLMYSNIRKEKGTKEEVKRTFILESEKFYKKEYLSKWHNDPMES